MGLFSKKLLNFLIHLSLSFNSSLAGSRGWIWGDNWQSLTHRNASFPSRILKCINETLIFFSQKVAFKQQFTVINCFLYSAQPSLTCTTLPTGTIPKSDKSQVFSQEIYVAYNVSSCEIRRRFLRKNLPKYKNVRRNIRSNCCYKLMRDTIHF